MPRLTFPRCAVIDATTVYQEQYSGRTIAGSIYRRVARPSPAAGGTGLIEAGKNRCSSATPSRHCRHRSGIRVWTEWSRTTRLRTIHFLVNAAENYNYAVTRTLATAHHRLQVLVRDRPMKTILFLMLLLLPFSAWAANPRINCTVACTATTDPYPASGSAAGLVQALLEWCAEVAVGSRFWSRPARISANGSVTFPVGTYTLTSTVVDSAAWRPRPANPFAFDSAVPLLPPANLRVL
jgi:hypothetical protein